MKKAKFILLLLVAMVLLCNTAEGASSAKDIEITEVNILEQNKEAHITVQNLPRQIGFNVFLNDVEITENCRIRFGTELLTIESILIVKLPKEYLNSSNTLHIQFYDQTDSKDFTESFDYLTSESAKFNWGATIAVIVGLLVFNLLGGTLMARKGNKVDNVTKNPVTKVPTHKEMIIKTVIAFCIAIGVFIYVYFHPYFYYSQLVDHNWGYVYDLLDYFSMGGFLVAIMGLSYHLFRLALGNQRKPQSTSTVNQLGTGKYYLRKIIGGEDTVNTALNKEKHPSLVVISKTIFILTMVFTLRILMLLLVSTLYEYFPNNFMLVLSSETISTHSVYDTLNILLQALSLVFLICTSFGAFVSLSKIYTLVFKKEVKKKNGRKVYTIIQILLPLIFFGLYQACVRVAIIINSPS